MDVQVQVGERTDTMVSRPGVGMKLEAVSVYYGAHKAVGEVSLTVQPNRVTALIGPSGCGKSTLLRTLNRMHEMTRGGRVEGTVLLEGEDIYGPRADPVQVRRLVGMVFQKPNPFPMMSIYDNVVAGIRLNDRRVPKSTLDGIVEHGLRAAALWDEVKDKLKQSGASLSGGQQQRLCIARTIAVEPEVVLMDEPCSALDPISTIKIEELIQGLKSRYTIMIVTHNMQQAARVADFTAFMLADETRTGRLVEYGRTADMFTKPTDRRTEAYITGRFG